MFLVAKRRQNGSPPLGAGFRRREREQMSAVSSLNPAFLSLAFACDVRSRDLSMASRYNRGRRPPKPEEIKQKNMQCKSDHNSSDHKRLICSFKSFAQNIGLYRQHGDAFSI